jgi:hypothetical protein
MKLLIIPNKSSLPSVSIYRFARETLSFDESTHHDATFCLTRTAKSAIFRVYTYHLTRNQDNTRERLSLFANDYWLRYSGEKKS